MCNELRKRNKREREGGLAAYWATSDLSDLARQFAELADMPDATPEEVQQKAARYQALIDRDPSRQKLHQACDAWTAAFFASRGVGLTRSAPTTVDVWNALAGRPDPQRAAIINELSNRFHFFHWRLEFPEVFEERGFDVMLGNPPWEVSQFTDAEYFESRLPQIAKLPGAARKAAIEQLKQTNPAEWSDFVIEKRASEATNQYYREAGRFPLTAIGKINSYALFSETFFNLPNQMGRAGIVIQSNILTDDTTKEFTTAVTGLGRLVSFLDMVNFEAIFPGIPPHQPALCSHDFGRRGYGSSPLDLIL